MRQILLFLTLTISITGAAYAENVSTWPTDRGSLQGRVDIVTQSDPGTRQRCRVHQLTENSITCGRGIGRKAVTYQRSDVLSIINPPSQQDRFIAWEVGAVSAALIAGSFFVPIEPLVIVMRVIGGFGFYAIALDPGDSADHRNDILVYQQPGTKLSVRLRK